MQIKSQKQYNFIASSIYVSSAIGNDANDGLTAGTAFQTLAKAMDTVRKHIRNGIAGTAPNITIELADGSYAVTAGMFSNLPDLGYLRIKGATIAGTILSGQLTIEYSSARQIDFNTMTLTLSNVTRPVQLLNSCFARFRDVDFNCSGIAVSSGYVVYCGFDSIAMFSGTCRIVGYSPVGNAMVFADSAKFYAFGSLTFTLATEFVYGLVEAYSSCVYLFGTYAGLSTSRPKFSLFNNSMLSGGAGGPNYTGLIGTGFVLNRASTYAELKPMLSGDFVFTDGTSSIATTPIKAINLTSNSGATIAANTPTAVSWLTVIRADSIAFTPPGTTVILESGWWNIIARVGLSPSAALTKFRVIVKAGGTIIAEAKMPLADISNPPYPLSASINHYLSSSTAISVEIETSASSTLSASAGVIPMLSIVKIK